MLLIGKINPRPEAYVQEYTEQVDITPWKYVKISGFMICIIVIGSIFIFNKKIIY